jgi:hypothetical protein
LNTPNDRGLPIGNLTSQFYANVYLNELDQFVKHNLHMKYYYRYVDDLVILHESSDRLNEVYELTNDFLKTQLQMEFHPFKKKLGLVSQGIDFVGFIHKPHRRYVRTRTLNKMKSTVHQWQKSRSKFSSFELKRLRGSINSYLGMVKWGSTYRLRKKLGGQIQSLFIRPDKAYRKLIITARD